MSSLPTPNYVVVDEVKIVFSFSNTKVLEAGSFVRPIHEYYLPSHIRNSDEYMFFNPEVQVYCYTHYGIGLLELKDIRKL